MKKIFNTAGNILGILIIIGAGVVLVLTLKGASPSDKQPTTFQSPIEKVVAPTATSALVQFSSPIKPTATPYAPPLCTFNAKTPTEEPVPESLLDKYVFSEPEPILDYKAGAEVIQWLPGDQRLLVARIGDGRQIGVLDIQNRQFIEYANGGRALGLDEVVWLEKEQTIAFSDITDANEYALYVAHGNGKVEQASADLASLHLAIGPDDAVTFISKVSRAAPKLLDTAIMQVKNIAFKKFDLPETKVPTHIYKNYKITWHPDKKQFAYYSDQAFYLVNSQTGDICQLDLGKYGEMKQWAETARWSPDGRFLAVLNTVGEPTVPFIDLTIIDLRTGKQKVIDIEGSGDKYAVAWAPNSRDVLVIAQNPSEYDRHNIYLVDVVADKSKQILENQVFLFTGFSGVEWSLNENIIALGCPWAKREDPKHLCLIKVVVQ